MARTKRSIHHSFDAANVAQSARWSARLRRALDRLPNLRARRASVERLKTANILLKDRIRQAGALNPDDVAKPVSDTCAS